MMQNCGRSFQKLGGKCAKGLKEAQREGVVSFSRQSRRYHASLTTCSLDFCDEKCSNMENGETYMMSHYLAITMFNGYHHLDTLFFYDFLFLFLAEMD